MGSSQTLLTVYLCLGAIFVIMGFREGGFMGVLALAGGLAGICAGLWMLGVPHLILGFVFVTPIIFKLIVSKNNF